MQLSGQQLPVTYVPNPDAADGRPVPLFTLNGAAVNAGDDVTVSGGGGGGTGNLWISVPGSDPNGVLVAVQGAFASDANGAIWMKTSGSNTNTGWEQRF